MQRAPDLKMLPRRLPSTNHVPSAKILGPGAKNSRPEAQDFGELEFSVRVWEGKYSLQDEEDLVVDFVTVAPKGSVDSVEYGDAILFSGASHPLEPIDTDLMKKPDPKCSVKSLSAKGPFLDDLSIKGHGNGKNPKNHEVGYVSSPFLCSSASQNVDTTRPLGPDEKECVWDASPSTNVSPHSSLDVIGVVKTKSVVKSCVTAYRSECIARDDTKCNVQGDSLESAKSSVSRASDSSGLSDDSNWTNLTGGANKPHQGNDPIWKAILAVRARDGILGMSHFRLLRRLGCGDIGSVYLSELSGTRCYFAMKVMDKESLEARKKLNRSQTEREILQLLDHPFLPTLYTHFETDRFSCLVMEFCSGGDLHTLRQRQPGKRFSEYAARFYAAEILLALEYLHMLGIIYRDLKPENVLVREDGHIMLSDFDLSLRCTVSPTLIKGSSDSVTSTAFCAQPACIEPTSVCIQPSCFLPGFFPRKNKAKSRKAKSEPRMQLGPLPELLAEPTQARSMSFVGTHEYLAPEIIKGEGHGSAVDWWTFGIFLHELLYGKTPFKGSGNRATLFNVVGQQLKIPDSPPTSYASRDLIKGLLMKEPQNRLGVKRGATEIKQHPFFEGVNWALIRSSTPPLIPKPVEIESPVKPGAVVEPVGGGHGGAGKQTVNTDVKAGGAKFLDFEFF